MAYITYEYYTDTFGGTAVSETDFTRYEVRSRLQLDRQTFNRVKYAVEDRTDFEIPEEVKLAQCALIDYLKDYDKNGGHIIARAAVSKQSETYAGVKTFEQSIRDVVKQYLGGTPWTYMGGGAGA